jgi:biotin transport system substrate-specific component
MFFMEQTSRMPREEGTLTKTRTLTKMALCVALLAISAYISFPLPFTPAMVTALTIVVNLVAFILKPHEAFLVLLAWMILGAVGVPVFVGGTAGLGKLVGPTGGFVVSFLVAGWLMSKLRGNANSFKRFVFLGIVVGMPVIYIGGCISMYLVAHMSVWATLVAAVFPFIVGDVVKVLIAAFLATRINKLVKD